MAKDIIKNIPLTLDINARKRLDGSIDIRLYSKDIATGQFEFTLVDEDNNPVELDETYSAQTLVKYEDEEKTYLDDMIIEGNIIRFIFPHDFITKDGIVTMYIYITKDNYTSDVAAISFNVYRSEIDDVATDIVAAYDKNYEDILAEFKQTLEDYKSTLPKADSVRAEIDEVLNKFSEDSQAKLSQYDTDVQQVITDINEAETSRVEAEGQRESAETSRKANEADRDQAESERQTNETKRQTIFETNESERDGTFNTNETTRQENETTRQQAETQRESAESIRVSAEEQREIDHANRSAEFDGKADKVVIKNLITLPNTERTITKDPEATYAEDNLTNYLTDNIKVGDKYYVSVDVKSEGNSGTAFFYSTGGSGLHYVSGNTTSNYRTISKIITGANRFALVRISNIPGRPQATNLTYQNLYTLNLTEIFGAGNEPTIEEVQNLLKLTGYIDEEYTLNNNEMLGHLMNGKANKKQEDWITPTLLNGWYAIRPNEPPQYMKDEFGFVHFRGAISKGATATSNVAFILPAEYRPDVNTSFGVSEINLSSRTIAVSIFKIGNVDFAGASLNSWYAISSITFKAV